MRITTHFNSVAVLLFLSLCGPKFEWWSNLVLSPGSIVKNRELRSGRTRKTLSSWNRLFLTWHQVLQLFSMLVSKINFPPQAAFSMEVACLTALCANPMWKKACSRKLTCSETGCGCVIVRRNKVSPRHWSNSPSDLLHRTLLFQILYSQYAPAFGSTKLFFMLLLSLMALGLIIQQWKWNNYRTINLRYRSKRRNDIDHFIWRIFAGSTCAYPQ